MMLSVMLMTTTAALYCYYRPYQYPVLANGIACLNRRWDAQFKTMAARRLLGLTNHNAIAIVGINSKNRL